MPSFEYAVDIAAPPERVWQATVDVERWPDFVPTFVQCKRTDSGRFGVGKSARVTPKGFIGSVWTVTRFDHGRSFTWESQALPGLRFAGSHTVEPNAGGARLVLRLDTTGWLAAVMSPLTSRTFRRNLKIEGDAFKSHCEAVS
jgi:uncharacterized protein YndB with AHSA1/START domain